MTTMEAAVQIHNRITAEELAVALGARRIRIGCYICPFHPDRVGTLCFNGRRGWHCYGCGAGGSVIDYVMRLKGMGYRQTLQWILRSFRFGPWRVAEETPGVRSAEGQDLAMYIRDMLALNRREEEPYQQGKEAIIQWLKDTWKEGSSKDGPGSGSN